MIWTTHIRKALGAAGLVIVAGSAATAQPARATREVMLIALEKPAQRTAMVYRRATAEGRDMIALAPSATEQDLNRALRLLDALGHPSGTTPGNQAFAVRAERRTGPAAPEQAGNGAHHAEFLNALRRAPRADVRGFGRVRSLIVRLASSQ